MWDEKPFGSWVAMLAHKRVIRKTMWNLCFIGSMSENGGKRELDTLCTVCVERHKAKGYPQHSWLNLTFQHKFFRFRKFMMLWRMHKRFNIILPLFFLFCIVACKNFFQNKFLCCFFLFLMNETFSSSNSLFFDIESSFLLPLNKDFSAFVS